MLSVLEPVPEPMPTAGLIPAEPELLLLLLSSGSSKGSTATEPGELLLSASLGINVPELYDPEPIAPELYDPEKDAEPEPEPEPELRPEIACIP